MNEQLQEQLKSLKNIRPNAFFLARSRTRLINAITPTQRFSFKSLMPVFRMSLTMGVFSLAIFLTAHQTPVKSAETVASLNMGIIKAEQSAANTEGSVTNAEYFNDISPVISLALTDIADPSTNWGSGTQIKQALALLSKNSY